jgi:hypothetical protein
MPEIGRRKALRRNKDRSAFWRFNGMMAPPILPKCTFGRAREQFSTGVKIE